MEFPTSSLRYVRRKYKLPPGGRMLGSGSQMCTHLVLQQQWKVYDYETHCGIGFEWRDVPIVEEEDSEDEKDKEEDIPN